MTLPPVVRVFFAIEPPESIKEKIAEYISALKKKSKPNTIRWTRKENLHITLQFIGEAKSDDLPKMINCVRDKIKNKIKLLELGMGELNLFPNPFRPRVIVLEISPAKELTLLADSIKEGVGEMNYPLEERAFRAHLTLGRIKQPKGLDLSYLTANGNTSLGTFPITDIVLFRSEPHTEGSIYTVLERLCL